MSTGPVNEDGLTIVHATYGVDTQFVDVTTEVKGLVQNGELDFIVSAQSLGIPDPNPGASDKQIFQLQYRLNGGHKNLDKFKTGEQVKLSAPNSKSSKKKVNHSWSFTQYLFLSMAIFIWGLFVMDGYKAGLHVFGTDVQQPTGEFTKEGSGGIIIGVLILLFGLANFGILPWMITLFVVVCFGFARRQR
jgi:hypothetical protein